MLAIVSGWNDGDYPTGLRRRHSIRCIEIGTSVCASQRGREHVAASSRLAFRLLRIVRRFAPQAVVHGDEAHFGGRPPCFDRTGIISTRTICPIAAGIVPAVSFLQSRAEIHRVLGISTRQVRRTGVEGAALDPYSTVLPISHDRALAGACCPRRSPQDHWPTGAPQRHAVCLRRWRLAPATRTITRSPSSEMPIRLSDLKRRFAGGLPVEWKASSLIVVRSRCDRRCRLSLPLANLRAGCGGSRGVRQTSDCIRLRRRPKLSHERCGLLVPPDDPKAPRPRSLASHWMQARSTMSVQAVGM